MFSEKKAQNQVNKLLFRLIDLAIMNEVDLDCRFNCSDSVRRIRSADTRSGSLQASHVRLHKDSVIWSMETTLKISSHLDEDTTMQVYSHISQIYLLYLSH